MYGEPQLASILWVFFISAVMMMAGLGLMWVGKRYVLPRHETACYFFGTPLVLFGFAGVVTQIGIIFRILGDML